MFGLGTGDRPDGADIDLIGHVAGPVLILLTRFANRPVGLRATRIELATETEIAVVIVIDTI